MNSSVEISVVLQGSSQQVPAASTGFTLFTEKNIVALSINGEPKDLAYTVHDGAVV